MCTQLLSVTKHRVGLSENQLRSQLYEKCRVLPVVFKEQCFAFVETSLPEIYYSINYDFSSKDICVRMKLCDDTNPFAVGGPLPPIEEKLTTEHPMPLNSVETRNSIEIEERPVTERTVEKVDTVDTVDDRVDEPPMDRIGHRNVLEIILPKSRISATQAPRNSIETRPTMGSSREIIGKGSVEQPDMGETEEKRLTCAFCEKMLENAKNYAVTSKADITAFANSACSSLPKGRHSDTCYQLADKKISELAKFVDQQVVDALWCAELNKC